MTGLASSLRSTPAQVLVNKYFNKKRSRAFSIGNLARGIASFVMPPVVAACFEEYAWSGGVLVLGAISMHVFIGPAVFRPAEDNCPKGNQDKEMKLIRKSGKEHDRDINDDQENERLTSETHEERQNKKSCLPCISKCRKQPQQEKKKTFLHVELLRDSWYMSFVLSLFFFNTALLSMIFLAPLSYENGYSPTQVSILVSLYGVADMVGSLVLGLVLDHRLLRSRRYHVCYVMYVMTGLASIGLGLSKDFVLFAIVVVLRGLSVSIYSLRIPVLSEVVGDEKLASGIALSAPVMGLGNFLGPLLGGSLQTHIYYIVNLNKIYYFVSKKLFRTILTLENE